MVPDEDVLEAISGLFEPAERSSDGLSTRSEEDFELVSDGESIEVLEAASEELDDPSAEVLKSGSGANKSNVTEDDEILRALGRLFKFVEIEDDSVLEALSELFADGEEELLAEVVRETIGMR